MLKINRILVRCLFAYFYVVDIFGNIGVIAAKEAKAGVPVKREMLKQREYRVDLDSKLGKSQVITKTTPTSQSGG